MANPTKSSTFKGVDTLTHQDATRKVIPTAEYQPILSQEQEQPVPVRYDRRNRDLDPQLVWRGKDEQDWSDLVVQAPPLYIQEKIHPKVLIDDLTRQSRPAQPQAEQLDLFADFNGIPAEADKTEFYHHDQNWTNRLILGDSLPVMASLAEREGLRGQVQCIYFDPPYGIKFNSNFQWSTTSRDVKDGNSAHITREPEQVKAFRDTWRDGIHSYLTYLRDRLTVARDLLTESGSIFVQIGDENVSRVKMLMDEIFGEQNFVALIAYAKTTGFSGNYLSSVCDYLVWYGRSISSLKYRPLFDTKQAGEEGASKYKPAATIGSLKNSPIVLTRLATSDQLTSQGASQNSEQMFYFRTREWSPPPGLHWKTTVTGLGRIGKAERIIHEGNSIRYVRFMDDFSIYPRTNIWQDVGGVQSRTDPKIYVVQTATEAVKRCILMATDPGDLVLDPTCVRKGTPVLAPLNPPACGGKSIGVPKVVGTHPQSPRRRGEGCGSLSFAPAGGGAGRAGEGLTTVPIEQLRPGDWVYAHDGQCHRVVRPLKRTYSGEMIGLRHEGSEEVLWLTADHLVLSQRRVQALSQKGGWSEVPKAHFTQARTLRNEMTLPERILWQKLRSEQVGVKFRRQHPIGPYIADFYTRDAGLVIEVDGSTHGATAEAIAHDQERDHYMQRMGLRVLRFTASEVTRTPWAVADAVAQACRERVLAEDASKQWRFASHLQVGDLVFSGVERTPRQLVAIERQTTVEEVYDLEVEDAHSFLTTVCAIHNCGSGTTAYVAEQWGRRWITIDTSRVALALARARIMGARYPYYLLADSREGQLKEAEVTRTPPVSQPTYGKLRHGFVYERVPHITLKSIANNAEIDVIWEKWQATLEPLREALNAAVFGPSPAPHPPQAGAKESELSPSPRLRGDRGGNSRRLARVGNPPRSGQHLAGGDQANSQRLVGGADCPAKGDRRLDCRQG